MKITDRNAKALKLDDGQKTAILSEDGLRLKLMNDSKRWEYRFSLNKKRYVMGLGNYPDVGVATARKMKQQAAELVAQGINPIEKRKSDKIKEEAENRDVKWLVDHFYKNYILKHRERPDQPKQIIDADILPGLGSVKLNDLTPMKVDYFLQGIVDRGSPKHANKVLTLLKQMFNYGISKGVMPTNPAATLTKKLVGGEEHAREVFLTVDEIKKLWLFLDSDEHGISQRYYIAFKLLILTGVRTGELLKARWSEIEGDYWTIPVEHIKTRKKNPRPHVVYLADRTKALFEQLKNDSDFIYPHQSRDKPVYEKTLSYVVRDSIQGKVVDKHWTPHDLRRSFATAQSEVMKVNLMVIEKLLNHSLGGMAAVYNKAEMLEERKQALQAWSDYLHAIIYTDNVVQFKAG